MSVEALKKELKGKADPKKAQFLGRFFKTGKGEYGEGDMFLGGISAPEQRKIARKYQDLDLSEIQKLLESKYHEERCIALMILVWKFEKARLSGGKQIATAAKGGLAMTKTGAIKENSGDIYVFYIRNIKYINNWDLVDSSADKILGKYLEDKDKSILYKLAKSKNLWERRIAIMATFHYIKLEKPEETLKIAKILLSDKEDLIHKAAGWMLREIGKRCREETEEKFLRKYYRTMPRTMLRYAIERFSEEKRKRYLSGTILSFSD